MNSSSVYSIGNSITKKATRFYHDYISSERAHKERVKDMLQEISHGEIIFSKNNVCVHANEQPRRSNLPSAGACGKNCLPGYFSIKLIKRQQDNDKRSSTDDLAKASSLIGRKESQVKETSFIIKKEFDFDREANKSDDGELVNGLNKDSPASSQNDGQRGPQKDLTNQSPASRTSSSAYLKQQAEAQSDQQPLSPCYSMIITWMPNLIFEEKPNKLTRNLSLRSTNSTNNSFSQSGKRQLRSKSLDGSTGVHPRTASYQHRLEDPENALRSYASDFHLSLISRNSGEENAADAENLIFQININQIKSLKLFFGSRTAESAEDGDDQEYLNGGKDGQLVIGNYDLKYKIFHFHNGGLSKLEQFLSDWCFVFCLTQKSFSNGLLSFFESIYEEPFVAGDVNNSLLDFYTNKFIQLKNQKQIEKEYNNNCIQLYTVNQPALDFLDLQNSTYKPVSIGSLEEYNQFFSADGRLIYDFDKLKTRVFFSGVEPSSRHFFYPYLLARFSANLTTAQKDVIVRHGAVLYKQIDEKRRRLNKDDKFYPKFVQYKQTVSVDLPRTDRCNKELQDKKTLKLMERILLNYTLYSRIGYTQGFSDLLAPLAIILKQSPESEIFFNFVYLIEKKGFFCLPNDDSIDSCMAKIRELLRVLSPKLYDYFKRKGDAFQLLFTHRWMLVCFRREFNQDAGLRIWEACWADFSVQFQLFVCIAIIQIYGHELVEKDQTSSDDILLFFSHLSQKMNADLVLKKARGGLFHFRSLTKIPCTLKSLCNLKCKPNSLSDWTTQLQPTFECVRSADEPDTLLLCTCDRK